MGPKFNKIRFLFVQDHHYTHEANLQTDKLLQEKVLRVAAEENMGFHEGSLKPGLARGGKLLSKGDIGIETQWKLATWGLSSGPPRRGTC